MKETKSSDQYEDSDFQSICSLMLAARGGDDLAREELFRQMQSHLFLMAEQQTRGNQNRKFGASDIVQQTCLLALRDFDNFQGSGILQFRAWLKAILNNAMRQTKRDLVREKRDVRKEKRLHEPADTGWAGHQPIDELLTPAANAIRREQLDSLFRALDRLPEDYRLVIRLRSLDRMSFQEVAETMNRTVHSVTKLWYRAFVQLQKLMEPADGDD